MARDQDGEPKHSPSPVVGIGASAGGLEALEHLFGAMPVDTGLTFVVVTHQQSGRKSLLPEILARHTQIPVVEVDRAMALEPDHIFIAAPGRDLAIEDGMLTPRELSRDRRPHMPIDAFFRSLAHARGERAIGIVLSGTGSDGSLGLGEIKAELGMVMAQDERTAQHGGMPHSAIATRLVDFVLPVEAIPDQLVAYAAGLKSPSEAVADELPTASQLADIFSLIRDRTRHDFSQYKESTVRRRVARRMNVHQVDAQGYVALLKTRPDEIQLLFRELLIGVTSFFRDPEAWEALAEPLRAMLAEKPADHVVRAWVPGCSTGEEAYSLAILIHEQLAKLDRHLDVQVFATDLDASAIDAARSGTYPKGIASDLTQERLARYFTADDDTFRVRKDIREMLIFAPQNVISDPPFTKLDLITCRNLLIYLEVSLQKRVLPLFHYALREEGLLFLGSSETLGQLSSLFAPVEQKWRIYRRKTVSPGAYSAEVPAALPDLAPSAAPRRVERPSRNHALEQVAGRRLLEDLVPPTVIVRERGEVIFVHGRTGQFLEPAPGTPNRANIFNMAREGLQISLAAAMRKATETGREVIRRGVQVRADGDPLAVDIRVRRLEEPEALRGLLRVTFEKVRVTEGDTEPDADTLPERLAELERELQYARESHQGTIEELEAANEELQSTNEELQSTNEELQSANEELETSKEEMQSLNEELQTVNAELRENVEELSRTNDDMRNLLNGTDIATVFLDRDLKIKRYTEQARRVIRLIPSDVGRPIGDLASSLRYDDVVEDARSVLANLHPREVEVQSEAGEHYVVRILPYRTTENVIDGLVLTFHDISALKELQAEQDRLLGLLRSSPVAFYGQDRDLQVTWACGSVLGREPAEIIGQPGGDLFMPEEAERLKEVERAVLRAAVPRQVRMPLTVLGRRRVCELQLEPEKDDGGNVVGLSSVIMAVEAAESD